MTKNKKHDVVTANTTFGSTRIAAVMAVSAGILTFTADQAQAQDACSVYTAVSGDTLSGIASAADVRGGFQFLFNANTDVLANPNLLEVGQTLKIPCADGSLPRATTASAASVVAPAAPTPTTATPDRALRIVTASGYAPFTDEALPGGGLLTQLVNRSMELGNPDQDYELFFVNDWGSHLDMLLPSGAVDMVFPWFKPDCTKVGNLAPSSAYRCTDFNHSEPFYDALVGYYVKAGSEYEGADSYEDLFGARLCRPEAWFTFDLEAEGLIEPTVTWTRPVPQDGCWELLMNGEIDVVSLDALPAEEDYTELGLADQVVNLPALTSKQTLHIFVSKDNAFANEALPIINAGLEELRLSGEWFSIVRDGIKATIEN